MENSRNMMALIEKFLAGTISQQEREILKEWVLQKKDNLDFFKDKIRTHSKTKLYHQFSKEEAFETFLAQIEKRPSQKLIPSNALKYAAVVMGLLSLGFIAFYSFGYFQQPSTVVQNEQSDETKQNNIVLSLSDGTKQIITADGVAEISDENGKIIAKKQPQELDFSQLANNTNGKRVFNEIYVPHGETFKVVLSDRTKIWLNSGTRLKFPQDLGYGTNNRIVYLEGEAYFDVTKNEKRPFIVTTENLDIKVLGTQFNVSAYKSDGKIDATLVEGSVRVYENSNPDTNMLLAPSYQASFTKENGTLLKKKVDTRIYTSWMNNKIIIDNLSFDEILRKLERTHNVHIINEVESLNNEMFKGEFENEDIESILNTIASSTPFTYENQNNVITITK